MSGFRRAQLQLLEIDVEKDQGVGQNLVHRQSPNFCSLKRESAAADLHKVPGLCEDWAFQTPKSADFQREKETFRISTLKSDRGVKEIQAENAEESSRTSQTRHLPAQMPKNNFPRSKTEIRAHFCSRASRSSNLSSKTGRGATNLPKKFTTPRSTAKWAKSTARKQEFRAVSFARPRAGQNRSIFKMARAPPL